MQPEEPHEQRRPAIPRQITTHAVNGLNEALNLIAVDLPGHGGANHCYEVEWPGGHLHVDFQNGPIAEQGVNGVSNEVLLAIVRDRLEGFQRGPYACKANYLAVLFIKDVMRYLMTRTAERAARGVEGTSQT